MRNSGKANTLKSLHDAHLIECYVEAVQNDLDPGFVAILLHEIQRRKIKVPSTESSMMNFDLKRTHESLQKFNKYA